jgi:transcriptional regulator GlxA family with amidase domain
MAATPRWQHDRAMKFTFVLYDEMTALDLIGPYQVLSMIPGAEVRTAATKAGPRKTDSGLLITADHALSSIAESDIIVVPGTSKPDVPMADPALVAWLAEAGPRAKWLTSVCTGSLVLGAAGLLKGRRATTHWMALSMLANFGADPVQERVVFDEHLVTAAGVSAGIDMALSLVTRIYGAEMAQVLQLAIEYDPEPPHQTGSPRTAPQAIVDKALAALTAAMN